LRIRIFLPISIFRIDLGNDGRNGSASWCLADHCK
jgi:hypothetical protein